MRFWVKILSKSAETLGRKGFYILWKKAGGKNTRGKPPGLPVLMAARSHSLGFGLVISEPVEGLFPPVS